MKECKVIKLITPRRTQKIVVESRILRVYNSTAYY